MAVETENEPRNSGFDPEQERLRTINTRSSSASDFQTELDQVTEEDQERMHAMNLEQEKNADRGSKLQEAKDVGKQLVKQEAKVLAKQVVKAGAKRVIVATAPYWGPVVGIIAAILLIIGVIVFVFMSIAQTCETDGAKGFIVRTISSTASMFGYTDVDICKEMGMMSGTPVVTDTGAQNISGDIMGEAEARAYLAQYGITVNKTCVDVTRQVDQTCLEGILSSTLQEVSRLKLQCDAWLSQLYASGQILPNPPRVTCTIVVTGGTEPGHALSASCIHSGGYKIDLRLEPSLDAYIAKHFTPTAPRSGDLRWVNNFSNSYYVKEGDHWDISVGCA